MSINIMHVNRRKQQQAQTHGIIVPFCPGNHLPSVCPSVCPFSHPLTHQPVRLRSSITNAGSASCVGWTRPGWLVGWAAATAFSFSDITDALFSIIQHCLHYASGYARLLSATTMTMGTTGRCEPNKHGDDWYDRTTHYYIIICTLAHTSSRPIRHNLR